MDCPPSVDPLNEVLNYKNNHNIKNARTGIVVDSRPYSQDIALNITTTTTTTTMKMTTAATFSALLKLGIMDFHTKN